MKGAHHFAPNVGPDVSRAGTASQQPFCMYTYCMSRRNFRGGIHLRVR